MIELTTILVVEDEKGISNIMKAYLEKENFTVLQAFDGVEAIKIFSTTPLSLIILDLMLPKMSGEEVCAKVRSRSNIPILMLTAKSELEDKVKGFKLGADDYLSKPFEPEELIARVHALLRRSNIGTPNASVITLENSNLVIDLDQMTVKKNGTEIFLTTNEFKILQTLLSNPNKVFTRDEIIELSFGIEYEAFDRAIDTHIKNIRAKIEDDPKHPVVIKTIYGMGYKAGVSNDIKK